MRTCLALLGMVSLMLAIDISVARTSAVAAFPKCVSFCNNWCAKNFAMKNPAACSAQCQIKHCK